MKQYTSPTVSSQETRGSYILLSELLSSTHSVVLSPTPPIPAKILNSLLGDDFADLDVNALMPCLEA